MKYKQIMNKVYGISMALGVDEPTILSERYITTAQLQNFYIGLEKNDLLKDFSLLLNKYPSDASLMSKITEKEFVSYQSERYLIVIGHSKELVLNIVSKRLDKIGG